MNLQARMPKCHLLAITKGTVQSGKVPLKNYLRSTEEGTTD